MRIARHTIHIPRSPETVFDFFADFSKAASWRQYVRTMERIGDGPLKPGSRIHVTMDLNGTAREFELEVLVCDRPSLWRHWTNESEFTGFIEYRFEPENGGTRVTMSIHARPMTVYGWLALPLMLLRREAPYQQQLPQLKRALESAG